MPVLEQGLECMPVTRELNRWIGDLQLSGTFAPGKALFKAKPLLLLCPQCQKVARG